MKDYLVYEPNLVLKTPDAEQPQSIRLATAWSEHAVAVRSDDTGDTRAFYGCTTSGNDLAD